jgi:uncharacterized protein (TIGR02466 family)
METNTLWSHIILKDSLSVDNNALKDFCYELKTKDPGNNISNKEGWQSSRISAGTKPLPPPLRDLNSKFKPIFDRMMQAYNFRENYNLFAVEWWVNINPKNAWNYPHNHANVVFAGTYYVNAPIDGGELVFENPTPSVYANINRYLKDNSSDQTTYKFKIQPKTGDVVVFPSWLSHFVAPNRSDEDRISIAFNIIAKQNNIMGGGMTHI